MASGQLSAPLLAGSQHGGSTSSARRQKNVDASYKIGDASSLAKAHEEIDLEDVKLHEEEDPGVGGDYVRAFVLGGLDGAVSVFSLVAGMGGAGVNIGALLAVGIAKLLAVSLSMGFGEYMSSTAEVERAMRVREREMWETENHIEGEVKEMCGLYIQKGVDQQDALTVLTVMAKYKDFFVDHMMVMEHGILPVHEVDRWQPLKQGIVCWAAFNIFGLIPLLGFLGLYALEGREAQYSGRFMLVSYCLTALTLFIMGVVKAKLISESGFVRTGMMMVFNGTIAGGSAYIIGNCLTPLLHF